MVIDCILYLISILLELKSGFVYNPKVRNFLYKAPQATPNIPMSTWFEIDALKNNIDYPFSKKSINVQIKGLPNLG